MIGGVDWRLLTQYWMGETSSVALFSLLDYLMPYGSLEVLVLQVQERCAHFASSERKRLTVLALVPSGRRWLKC